MSKRIRSMHCGLNEQKPSLLKGHSLRDDNMILLAPLSLVARVAFRDWAAPEDTKWVGRTWWVWASRSRYHAGTALEIGVESLASQGTCAPVSAFLDIVARHDRVSGGF